MAETAQENVKTFRDITERLREPLAIDFAIPLPVSQVIQHAADERGEAAETIEYLRGLIAELEARVEEDNERWNGLTISLTSDGGGRRMTDDRSLCSQGRDTSAFPTKSAVFRCSGARKKRERTVILRTRYRAVTAQALGARK